MFTNFEIMSNQTHYPVNFIFLVDRITLKDRNKLKRFLINLLRSHGRIAEAINYIFCSDKYLLTINRKFLKHDFYTDIITFDLSDDDNGVQAEIYISVDRVRDNAKKIGVSIKSELHRVIIHGAMHLCGYNDKSQADKSNMRRLENDSLTKYFGHVPRKTVSG